MKKVLVIILVLSSLLPVFSNGNSEQKPLFFSNQNPNLVPVVNTQAVENSDVEKKYGQADSPLQAS